MDLARQVASVLLVFALLGCALWFLRRKAGAWQPAGGRSKSLQSLERLALSPQHSLHIVQVDGRRLVLATHPQGCTLLTELTDGEPE